MTEIADRNSATLPADTGPGGSPSPGQRPPRLLFVRLAILASVLVTLIAVGLIGWRWSRVHIPDMVIVARGDDSSNGAEVVIRSDDDNHEIARGLLEPGNDYELIVMVDRGRPYSIRVTLGTTAIMEGPVMMPKSGDIIVPVKIAPEVRAAATQASTQPAPAGATP